jgi:hypothetical protein
MHRTTPRRLLSVCAAALTAATCAFPTDNSPKVLVLIEAPRTFVLRGAEMSVHARAVRIVGTDTMAVPNVDFAWASGSGNLATVTPDCCGYATITGVNSGVVDIVASAVNFNQATAGDLSLRVANPLEIDSVRPRIIRYGGLLTVYGIGVDSIFLASIGAADLIPYPFSAVRDSASGTARITYWVPPPATTDNLFYLGAGVFGFADSATGVLPFDVFEPNDTTPSKIDLDAGGPWPQLPFILFLNPALAFEQTPRGQEGADWFDFVTTDSTSDYTFFINYPSSGDTSGTRTFLLDSLAFNSTVPGGYSGRDSADFAGSDFLRCKGFQFSPLEAARDSSIVALRGLPSHSMHVVTFFQQPQRYGLTVVKGYVTSDPRIQPDKYQPNEFCHYADFGNRNLGLATGFSDTLTIDNPFEVDWLRVTVPALNTIRIRTTARPFPPAADTSDIDLYVLTVPNSGTGTGLTVVGADTAAGSLADVSVTAPASPANSSYYIAVVDFAGVPTRYSLCFQRVALPGACAPIPAPPAPAPSLAGARSRRTRLERRAHLAPFGAPLAPSRRRAGSIFDPWRNPRP